jgi:hypothetical protein
MKLACMAWGWGRSSGSRRRWRVSALREGVHRTTEHARALFKPGGAQPLNINPAGTRIDDLIVLLHPFDGQGRLKLLGLRQRPSCLVPVGPKIGRDWIGLGHPTRKATKGVLGRRVRPARPPDRRRLMRKPNYRFERAERDRLKQAKKEEKAKRQQQERASDQKSEEAGQLAPSAVSGNG